MKKIIKGEFGYLEKQSQRELIKTLVLFSVSFGILLIGILLTGSKNNLLTIVAVLGLLPASKELISCVMFQKAKKFGCPEELYKTIENIIKKSVKEDGAEADKTDPDTPPVVYDLYMTSQEANYPILSMCCHNKTLIGLADWDKFNYQKAEEHIRIMLKQNGHKNITIKLFSEQEKYISRIEELAEQKSEHKDTDQAVLRLMLNLSL